jgi:hypothetical protein
VKNLSPNLSPARGEALNLPPSLVGKGARGLGHAMIFPHNVKSEVLICGFIFINLTFAILFIF